MHADRRRHTPAAAGAALAANGHVAHRTDAGSALGCAHGACAQAAFHARGSRRTVCRDRRHRIRDRCLPHARPASRCSRGRFAAGGCSLSAAPSRAAGILARVAALRHRRRAAHLCAAGHKRLQVEIAARIRCRRRTRRLMADACRLRAVRRARQPRRWASGAGSGWCGCGAAGWSNRSAGAPCRRGAPSRS